MNTYLYPVALRRGQPSITSVEKKSNFGISYWLVTHSELIEPKGFTKKFKGLGSEYMRSGASRISKELYNAFIAESRMNHKKFK